uniref:Muscarinic acetylcholine receptor n=1 Tax=Denticeps clupeoides TaxID=299321 RepID=A0AAY4AJ93_9TELE
FRLSNSTWRTISTWGHQVWEVVLIVLVTGPLSIITIVANLLVVISFRVNAELRTTSNYYLLSLAVADLILGTVSMNLYSSYMITGRWTLGHLACDLWLAVDYVASNASVMNLLVISFDRYFSVTRPLTYRAKRTPKRAALLIALAWMVSFILWGPAILFWPYVVGRKQVREDHDCSIPFLKVPVLAYGTAIAAFYLPVSIMIILYWRIYWEIENRAKGLAVLLGSVNSGGTPEGSDRRSTYPSSTQSSIRDPIELQLERRWEGPRDCIPGMQGTPQTDKVQGVLALAAQRCDGSIPTVCNDHEEEDDNAMASSSTEDEMEQEVRHPACALKLEELQDPASQCRRIKISPRAAVHMTEVSSNQSSPKRCRMLDQSPFKNHKGKRRRNMIIREKKAARTLSAILLAFILTWTPYNIMVLASVSYCVPEKLWQIGYWLCYINSTVNPVCYALCNKSFRVTFKMLLLCRPGDCRRLENSRCSYHASVRVQKTCSTV